MVSITTGPDFSNLQVHGMKSLLDNVCVFHGVRKASVPKRELREFPPCQFLPVLAISVGPTQPLPSTHLTGRVLGISQGPSSPQTFSFDHLALRPLYTIFTVPLVLSPT